MSQLQSNKDKILSLLNKSAKAWRPKDMAAKLGIHEPTLYTTINRMHKANEVHRDLNGKYTVTPEKDPRQISLFPEIELAGELEAAHIDEVAIAEAEIEQNGCEDLEDEADDHNGDEGEDEYEDEDENDNHPVLVTDLTNTIRSQRYLINYLEARIEALSWRNYKQRAHISGINSKHKQSKRVEGN